MAIYIKLIIISRNTLWRKFMQKMKRISTKQDLLLMKFYLIKIFQPLLTLLRPSININILIKRYGKTFLDKFIDLQDKKITYLIINSTQKVIE